MVGVGRSGTDAGEPVPGQLIVRFEEGTTPEEAAAVLARVNGEVEERIEELDARVVRVPSSRAESALAAVEASPLVEYAEQDVAMNTFDTVPNDSLWPEQWGPARLGAPAAWDLNQGRPRVVIAVLDTGVDAGHPDLQSATVPGYDVVGNDAEPGDDNGHGTAAAGVIAARTNNGQGQAGMCWACSIMPVKVLDAGGAGSSSTVAAGIVWAADHGAHVISMSLGGTGTTQTLTDAVQYAAGRGAILVAAAGNAGTSDPTYPAAYPQVIGVAGTTTSDGLYSWSNHGSWVQVAAPGCNVAPALGGGYVNFCGTSSAAPLVAGLAGLALSVRSSGTGAEVEDAIRRSAVSLPGVVRYGRIEARTTLTALGARPLPPPAAPPAPPPPAAAPQPAATTPSPPSEQPPSPSAPAPPSQPGTREPGGRAVSPTSSRETSEVRGALTSVAQRRTFARSLGTGTVTARLDSGGSSRLTLTVLDGRGDTVGRVSGRKRVRLERRVAAGRYTFVVSGAAGTRTRFTLAIAAAGSPSAAAPRP